MWGWERGGTDCISLIFNIVFLAVKSPPEIWELYINLSHIASWISLRRVCASGTGISAVRGGEPRGTDSISQFPRDQHFQTGSIWNRFGVYSVRFLGHNSPHSSRDICQTGLDCAVIEVFGMVVLYQLNCHRLLAIFQVQFPFSILSTGCLVSLSLLNRMRTGRIGKLRVLGAIRRKGTFMSNISN